MWLLGEGAGCCIVHLDMRATAYCALRHTCGANCAASKSLLLLLYLHWRWAGLLSIAGCIIALPTAVALSSGDQKHSEKDMLSLAVPRAYLFVRLCFSSGALGFEAT